MPDGSTAPVRPVAPTGTGPARDRGDHLEPAGRGGVGKPLVMLWPGFGVGATYYLPIAEELARRGFPAAVGELRGQGASTARAARGRDWGYRDLAFGDYPRAIEAAKGELGLAADHPTVLLTHSLGGQIGILFLAGADARRLNVLGLFGVGTGSPYHRAFPQAMARRIRVGARLFGAAGRTLGYWPGRVAGVDVAGYGRQPARLTADWRGLALENSFAHAALAGPGPADLLAALGEVRAPVLLTRFTDDAMCPRASAEALAEHLPAADVRVEELTGGLGHNRWAREPGPVADRFVRFVAGL